MLNAKSKPLVVRLLSFSLDCLQQKFLTSKFAYSPKFYILHFFVILKLCLSSFIQFKPFCFQCRRRRDRQLKTQVYVNMAKMGTSTSSAATTTASFASSTLSGTSTTSRQSSAPNPPTSPEVRTIATAQPSAASINVSQMNVETMAPDSATTSTTQLRQPITAQTRFTVALGVLISQGLILLACQGFAVSQSTTAYYFGVILSIFVTWFAVEVGVFLCATEYV